MNRISFDKPPLVELIVELRWLPPGIMLSATDPNQLEMQSYSAGSTDTLFVQFAGLIGQDGFVQSERLTPPGFPTIPFQPAYRYSESGAIGGKALYQLGPGIFSVHITPPYKRWEDFRPFVMKGIHRLFSILPLSNGKHSVTGALVRYIDCFNQDLMGHRSHSRFSSEVLGITLALPKAISNRLDNRKEVAATVALSIPLPSDMAMSVTLYSGRVGQQSGLIMDSSVGSTKAVVMDANSVMTFLDGAHQTVSDYFLELTESLHNLMAPK